MFRECLKCKEIYGGSWVGAMAHHANPKDKIGYFGGYCRCGEKLSESYSIEGIEIVEGDFKNTKRVYSSDWLKWREGLSDAEHRKIFGGSKKDTITLFDYKEIFLARSKNAAKKKFFNLLKILKRQIINKARVKLARLYGEKWSGEKELWLAVYTLESIKPDSVRDYLKLKRKRLGVESKNY